MADRRRRRLPGGRRRPGRVDPRRLHDHRPLPDRREATRCEEMTSDALNPRTTYATLPTDQINYMRNSVKAVVDAYDGTVTLYEWDDDGPDPQGVGEGVPRRGAAEGRRSPTTCSTHMRYPEDLFKVQRNMLAQYHVTDPKTFYEGTDQWEVPEDPDEQGQQAAAVPALGDARRPAATSPVFSLTSVYVPHEPAEPRVVHLGRRRRRPATTTARSGSCGCPSNTQVPGPSQIANQFAADDEIAEPAAARSRRPTPRSLLRQPAHAAGRRRAALRAAALHAARERRGHLPGAAVRAGRRSARRSASATTLTEALDDVLGSPRPDADDADTGGAAGDRRHRCRRSRSPATCAQLLQQAEAKFAEAETGAEGRRPRGLRQGVRARPGTWCSRRSTASRPPGRAPVRRAHRSASTVGGRRDAVSRRSRPPRTRFGVRDRSSRKVGFTDAGWSSSVARWAHNPEVAGSNPAPATTAGLGLRPGQLHFWASSSASCVQECVHRRPDSIAGSARIRAATVSAAASSMPGMTWV